MFDQQVKTPATFPCIAGLKRLTVAVLRTTALNDALEAEFLVGFNGDRSVSFAPAGREHLVLGRTSQSLDEHERVGFEEFVNSVAQPHGQDLLAVFGSKFSGDFTKHMRLLNEATGTNFCANHIAHGNNGYTRLFQHGSKFTFSGPGHAANRHHLSHEGMAMPVAQEDTCSNKASVQFENSARPQRRSINFHNTAEAKINPMEIAIMPMYPCWTIVSSYICAVAARPS